jgi:hypothetical protein
MASAHTAAAPVARRRPPRATSRVPVIIAVAAFTPYVGLPIDIRVEHFIVYALAIVAVASRGSGGHPPLDAASRRLLTVWLVATVIITLNTFVARTDIATAPRFFFTLSVLDNFLLPVAIFLALAVYGTRRDIDSRDGLRATCSAIVILLSLNSILILAVEPSQIQPILRLFWSNEASPYLFIDTGNFTSVAARTLTDNRYGGIFNQPYDGGLGYAVGLAAWFVLYTRRARGVGILATPVAQFVVLGLLVAGGLSTLSKVFIYGALLVAFSSLGIPMTGTRASIGRSIALLGTAPFAVLYVSRTWLPATSDRAFGLLSVYGDDDAVSVATGGRVSDFALYPAKLLNAMTPFGRGWGGIRDDAFLAFVEGAGPLGLLLYLSILVMLFLLPWRFPPLSVERRLALSLALLTSLSSLGAIPLQVNRGSSLLWLLLGLLYARARVQRRPRPPSAGRPRPATARQTSE